MDIRDGTPEFVQRKLTLSVGVHAGNIKVDDCIYCGKKDQLTEEHTIPKGLWGQYVIQNGSCKGCAKLTSKVELAVLRNGLGRAREYLGAGTRHSRKRKIWTGKTQLENEDGDQIEMPIGSIGQMAAFPCFPYLPRALSSETKGQKHRKFDIQLIPLNKTQDPAASGYWGPKIRIDSKTWARFIAKVAYGEYIRTVDPIFRSERLAKFVLHGKGDQSRFVGGRQGGPKVLYMHNTGFSAFARENGKFAVIVYVRLLTFIGSPSYLVYLGDIECEENIPKSLHQVENWSVKSNVWPNYPIDWPLADFP